MYYFFIIGKILASMVPRNFCYFAAKILAVSYFYISRKDREAVNYNLLPVVEDKKKRKRAARSVFVNFSYYLVDFFRYKKLNRKFIEKYVKISGLNFVDESISRKKGTVFLTAHLGNYELGGAIASLIGYHLYAVALPHKDKRTNEFFNRQRESVGVKIISTGAAVKSCFSLLKKGEMIAFLGDRDFTGGGVKVEMFSKHAYIPRGAFFFALKTGACILPSFFVRENKMFYHLIFEKPIFCGGEIMKEDNSYSENKIMKEYLAILEKYIKMYPQQWYMFEKYWAG